MVDIISNVRHGMSLSNPEISFLFWNHIHKHVKYSYFKPTRTLIIQAKHNDPTNKNNVILYQIQSLHQHALW